MMSYQFNNVVFHRFMIVLMTVGGCIFLSLMKKLTPVYEEISPSSLENTKSQHVNCYKENIIQYTPPPLANIAKSGKPMNVDQNLMTSLGIPLRRFVNVSTETAKDFVFVTASSSDHFEESFDAVGSVQKLMPGYRIYYYDLGLEPSTVTKITTFCNVIYKKLDFTKYPSHVKTLTTYAFKSVILQEVLHVESGAVWMDTSFRLLKNISSVSLQLIETDGFLQFWHNRHTNYVVTNSSMYKYLPTNVYRQKEVWQRGAGAIIFYKTEKVYWGIFHWWLLCALDVDCIAPKGSKLSCNFTEKEWKTVYADCHRYDQSALGILASNLYGYNESVYTERDGHVVKIARRNEREYELKYCIN